MDRNTLLDALNQAVTHLDALLMSGKKWLPSIKRDVGMWVGSHPKSYVIAVLRI
jgi:hypothetical protein